jgi:O-glycosyl hydrolase
MYFKFKILMIASIIALMGILMATNAVAQNVTVTLGTTHQNIKGFGGMNHTIWISDLATWD